MIVELSTFINTNMYKKKIKIKNKKNKKNKTLTGQLRYKSSLNILKEEHDIGRKPCCLYAIFWNLENKVLSYNSCKSSMAVPNNISVRS